MCSFSVGCFFLVGMTWVDAPEILGSSQTTVWALGLVITFFGGLEAPHLNLGEVGNQVCYVDIAFNTYGSHIMF